MAVVFVVYALVTWSDRCKSQNYKGQLGMLIAATAFILGILSAFYWPEPSLLICLWAFLLGLPLLSQRWLLSGIAILILVLGFIWGELYLQRYYQGLIPSELEGTDLTIEALITEIPIKRHKGWRMTVNVNHSLPKTNIRTLQLNWYSDEATPKLGELWQFTVRLKRPHGYANPGSFDYERWMLSRGLQGRGYIRDADRLHNATFLNLRQTLWDSIQIYPGDGGSLVSALVLGEKQGLSHEQRQLFIDSGTAHLFAISGLHIGMLAAIFYLVAKAFVLCALYFSMTPNFLCNSIYRITPLKICLACSWLGCIAYAALAGFSLSTQRALIMLSVFYIACALRQRVLSLQSFAIALMLVLLLQPAAVLGIGLVLSFSAVAWIAYILHVLPSHSSTVKKVLYIQILLPVCLWPILQLYFGSSAALGAVANFVLIPVVSFVVLPLCLIATCFELFFAGANTWLFHCINELYQHILAFLDLLNAFTWAKPVNYSLTINQVLLLQVCLALVLLPKGMAKHIKKLAMLTAIIILLPNQQSVDKGQFKASVLDVGQGLSVLVQTKNHSLLFDTGPEFPSGFSASKAVIIPYLHKQQLRKLNMLMISHGDQDHLGGLTHLLNGVEVERIVSGQAERIPSNRAVETCLSGQSWQWDEVHFQVLWPHEDTAKMDPKSNNQSCVLRIHGQNQSLLITGDIEKAVERQLLSNNLRTDILVAPHHGSNSSSSTRFIQAVNPDMAIFSAGYRSRFGHPDHKVLQRYADEGVETVATANCGLFIYSSTESKCYRSHQLQRWQLKKHDK